MSKPHLLVSNHTCIIPSCIWKMVMSLVKAVIFEFEILMRAPFRYMCKLFQHSYVVSGLEEEESVHFSEHIFLENHLEDWCPKKGPIRHYMELVCVGLAKNPFYTVQEKRDHIVWYKEYFESKKSILVEVGAWDNATEKKTEASA